MARSAPPPPPPAEPRIKGSVVREFLLWHDRRHGHADTARLADAVPADLRARLDPSQPALGVLGASWYPTRLAHPMLDLVAERAGDEGRGYAIDANREVVPRMIRGVYKVLFDAVATPELYARHVPRMWRRLHSTGNRGMRIVAPGEARSTLEQWPGHHPMMCWITIYTMAFVFQAMGYPKWSVERVACVAHGGARCETILLYGR